MAARSISPRGYQRITLLTLVGLALIIVVGGAVRLTGSGLGCPEWPNCETDRLVAPAEYHAVVEFVNRSLSGLVGVPILLSVLGAFRRKPRRTELIWLSSALLGGVVVQILIGRLTVLSGLSPLVVMTHFLLAMAMLADGVVLHWAARRPGGPAPPPAVAPEVRHLGNLIVGTTAAVALLGTVVTAAGPHGGDENAERLDLPLGSVARLHGVAVILLLAMVTMMLVLLRRPAAPAPVRRAGAGLLAILLAQAVVGYAQYFTGVPVVLVAIHIAGAVLVWMAALRLRLALVDHGTRGIPLGARERDLVPA
ncbi:MAG TPA: COX15/CtaA family protein [Acidimicrobiales bacterium]|nr:COX15/CtaA family protein [Acidimicrobiales bacterium]